MTVVIKSDRGDYASGGFMKKMLMLVIGLMIAGCASVTVQQYYKDRVFAATVPAHVVVFQKKPEGKAFVEIGEVTVDGAVDWNQIDKIFKTRAAEMGGDAVYVFSQKEVTREYVTPDECYVHYGYYYPYHHFGWHRYHPDYYYPRGYYYCYGYPSTVETSSYLSAVGIVVKYGTWPNLK